MRKLILSALAVVLLITAVVVLQPAETKESSGQKVKHMGFYTYPAMKSIKLKWKEKKGVAFYRVYRVDLKDRKDTTPDFSKYQKVGKVAGKKSSWTDRKVKKNQYYGYVVRGYKKSGGKKAVLAYDSYMDDDCDYACANLDRPEILNGGSGEFNTNSKDVLYLYVQRDSGVRPDGVVLYRKADTDASYKKVKARKVEEGPFDQGMTYKDATVKPGRTYLYKARTYKKYKGEKQYSSYSDALTISTLNFNGLYDVESLTAPGTVKSFVIKFASADKYNGVLKIMGKVKYDNYPIYRVEAGEEESLEQLVQLTGYSIDNSNWKDIPAAGVTISAGETLYLKFDFRGGAGDFRGSTGKLSEVYADGLNVDYVGSAGAGPTALMIDLIKGTAVARYDEEF